MDKGNRPKVGVGVYIRKEGKILFMLRTSSSFGNNHWTPVGGHLEFGESQEECAKREALEEVGVEIKNVRLMAVTNDVYEDEKIHSISFHMVADWKSGEERNIEPDKCKELKWVDWEDLPRPLMKTNLNFLELNIDPIKF